MRKLDSFFRECKRTDRAKSKFDPNRSDLTIKKVKFEKPENLKILDTGLSYQSLGNYLKNCFPAISVKIPSVIPGLISKKFVANIEGQRGLVTGNYLLGNRLAGSSTGRVDKRKLTWEDSDNGVAAAQLRKVSLGGMTDSHCDYEPMPLPSHPMPDRQKTKSNEVQLHFGTSHTELPNRGRQHQA